MAYVFLPYWANEFEKLVVVSSLLCVHAIRRRLDMDVDAGGSAVQYFRLRESIIWTYPWFPLKVPSLLKCMAIHMENKK